MQTIDFFSSSANLKNWEWNRLQSLPNGIFFSHLNNRQNDCRVKPIQDSNLCPIQNAMFSFGFGILLCLKSFTFLIFSSLSFPPPGNETIHWILVLHASMYALLPLCPSYIFMVAKSLLPQPQLPVLLRVAKSPSHEAVTLNIMNQTQIACLFFPEDWKRTYIMPIVKKKGKGAEELKKNK